MNTTPQEIIIPDTPEKIMTWLAVVFAIFIFFIIAYGIYQILNK